MEIPILFMLEILKSLLDSHRKEGCYSQNGNGGRCLAKFIFDKMTQNWVIHKEV